MGPSSSHQTVNSDDADDYDPVDSCSSSEEESLCSSIDVESHDEMNDGHMLCLPRRPYLESIVLRPTKFFNEIDMEAARDPQHVDGIDDDAELYKGKMYQTKAAFKLAIKLFSVREDRIS